MSTFASYPSASLSMGKNPYAFDPAATDCFTASVLRKKACEEAAAAATVAPMPVLVTAKKPRAPGPSQAERMAATAARRAARCAASFSRRVVERSSFEGGEEKKERSTTGRSMVLGAVAAEASMLWVVVEKLL